MVEVRGTQSFLDAIGLLLASGREELLIGFGNFSLRPSWLLVINECRLATEREVWRDHNGLHWSGELTAALYAQAKETERGLLLVHVHGGRDEVPRLSKTDQLTVAEILPHFGMLLPDVPHAYLVVNETHASGWMQFGEERDAVDLVRAVTTPIRQWQVSIGQGEFQLERDDRQAKALGVRGIRALRNSSIGIVGLGGVGSQVAEMLAHAGVGTVVLADDDVVKAVNLSRTHGSSAAVVGILKVVAAKQMIEQISPESHVVVIDEAFPTPSLLEELRDVSVVISCVDTPHARNELNRFALRYGMPLIDVGTTITEEPFAVDGHLTVVIPDGLCLRCLGHVSDALLEEVRAAALRGKYGLNEGRPQVVSFNGLLASAAVTEALKLITGFSGQSEGSREWHYDPVQGELRTVRLLYDRCRECGWYALKADRPQRTEVWRAPSSLVMSPYGNPGG
jgi:molybdopterin/thiamine biosynthesis adenylyltransferase